MVNQHTINILFKDGNGKGQVDYLSLNSLENLCRMYSTWEIHEIRPLFCTVDYLKRLFILKHAFKNRLTAMILMRHHLGNLVLVCYNLQASIPRLSKSDVVDILMELYWTPRYINRKGECLKGKYLTNIK